MTKRNITRDFLLVVVVVIIGKVMGFARELIVAYLYGASNETDAFYYVNGLITSMLSIITMGLGQAFTPLFLDTQLKKGKIASSSFADKIVTILVALGSIVSILMLLFPGTWLSILAPDLSIETRRLSETMLKIMGICVPVFICFSIRKCILNANNKYIITEASGIPYSISIVFFTLLLYNAMGSFALPIAAVFGIIFQFFFTFAFSFNNYRFHFPHYQRKDEDVCQYLNLLVPIALGAIMEEANGLLRKSLAGGMGEGAIANLSYCMTLTTLINGIIITSMSTVYFPHLIKNYSESDFGEFRINLKKCLSMASVFVIPLVVYLFVYSNQVVEAVYERGSFTHTDTLEVGALFSVYVLGTIVYAYRCVIRTAFYSTKNVKTPMINELIYLIICMVCNIFQVKVLKSGLISLGIAWVIAIGIMTPILFIQFKKQYFPIIDRYLFFETIKAVLSAAIVAIFLFIIKGRIVDVGLVAQLSITLISSITLYCALMITLKSKTVEEIKSLLVK